MSESLALSNTPIAEVPRLPIPWRDPNTVSPGELVQYIQTLEAACREHPDNPDLRTCLGLAQAMNLDIYQSMDSLETALRIDSNHFWAQVKYAELLYRLRCLPRAEEETQKAMELSSNSWELSIARKQLLEIRRLMREGTQRPAWTKPLSHPTIMLVLLIIMSGVVVLCR